LFAGARQRLEQGVQSRIGGQAESRLIDHHF
jgi:hypothetical protein